MSETADHMPVQIPPKEMTIPLRPGLGTIGEFYEMERASILVTEFVKEHLNFRELEEPLTDRQLVEVTNALRGVRVEVNHLKYRRSYRIRDVSRECTSKLSFFDRAKGTMQSVEEYYLKTYKIRLKYAFLPALMAVGEKNVALPMELCKIIRRPNYSKELLSDEQLRRLLDLVSQHPLKREKAVVQMVEKTSTVVNARVLPSPMLKYHDTSVKPRKGQWNIDDKKMVSGGTVDYWTCISLCDELDLDAVYRFCEKLVSTCSSKGMNFCKDPLVPVHACNPGTIKTALLDVHSQSTKELVRMGHSDKQLQLLILILPDRSEAYGTIKRVCETELGIMSQCCRYSSVKKWRSQFFDFLALKINTKVEGTNHLLYDAISNQLPLVTDQHTIIFGAYVNQPPNGDRSRPSIAAVVASVDWPEITKYEAQVSSQPCGMEIIQDLREMARSHLIKFKDLLDYYPRRIIFYRGGVCETQFCDVLLLEVLAIQEACASLEMEYLPAITFVVVQKNCSWSGLCLTGDGIYTHFSQCDRDRYDVFPGTVVDTMICHPKEHGFYLKSNGFQGTRKPMHYWVLVDENKVSADDLQRLTNNLCYTNASSTESISVVAPVRYAHLAAARARLYIEENETSPEVRPLPAIKDKVKKTMFYC